MPNLDRDAFTTNILSKCEVQLPHDKIVVISHHLAHAYSTYWSSGFLNAAVLVVDGQGNSLEAIRRCQGEDSAYTNNQLPIGKNESLTEKLSAYSVSDGVFTVLRKDFTVGSVGGAYVGCTWLIFGEGEPGKTMGLAPFGRSDLPPGSLLAIENGIIDYRYVSALTEYYGFARPKRWPPNIQDWTEANNSGAALANRIQEDLEEVLLELARDLKLKSGMKYLCLAGGVALNSVANRKLIEKSGFDDVFIVPAAGDDGISLGCAYWGASRLGELKPSRMKIAAFGRTYQDAQIEEAIASDRRIRAVRLSKSELIGTTAEALHQGKIVACFQGGSEMGPRALGNRSILADPTNPIIKDRLNLRVKFREPFRPFAPILSASALPEYFHFDRASPFMLVVAPVSETKRVALPAITHVDGTARIQTASAENGFIYELILEFEKLSGIPILVNTSLNVRGEPIVETPSDAIRVLLHTEIDALVISDWFCRKEELTDDQLREGLLRIPDETKLSYERSYSSGRYSAKASVTLPFGRQIEIDEALLGVIDDMESSVRVVDLIRPKDSDGFASEEPELLDIIRRGLAQGIFGIS